MKCTDCAHYVICKSLNNTGIFAEFPKVDFCPIFKPNSESKVKESEKKKMQPATESSLKALLNYRGYKIFEVSTYGGKKFVGTDISVKYNVFLLTNAVYCDGELFSTVQDISEVRILFFK